MKICAQEAPPKVEITGGGIAKCHLHTSGPVLAGLPIRTLTDVPEDIEPVAVSGHSESSL
jgi:hypothetical protein